MLSFVLASLITFGMKRAIIERRVARHGELVEVQPVDHRESRVNKTTYSYLTFFHNEVKYTINIRNASKEELMRINKLQKIKLKHLKKYPGIYIFPAYTGEMDFYSGIFIILFSMYCSYYGFTRR